MKDVFKKALSLHKHNPETKKHLDFSFLIKVDIQKAN